MGVRCWFLTRSLVLKNSSIAPFVIYVLPKALPIYQRCIDCEAWEPLISMGPFQSLVSSFIFIILYFFRKESPSPQPIPPNRLNLMSHTTWICLCLGAFDFIQWQTGAWHATPACSGVRKFLYFMTKTASSLRKVAIIAGCGVGRTLFRFIINEIIFLI